MPEGVAVGVADGEATIEFLDRDKLSAGLNALLAAAEPDPHVVAYKTSPSRYVVPEAVARAAGLLDGRAPTKPVEPPKGYDDGQPDMDWSRPAIDEFAARLTPPLDTTGEKNKPNALKAIEDHQKANKATPEQGGQPE